ncbi:MAG TPA: hypothetical protein VHK47_24340 [Polyangia bacterium]|jgi:hypothetical protein|nr:hypothetical protein [Polyangia bacterium]
MKRILMTLVPVALLAFGASALAADAGAAADCAAKQKALDDANAAAKTASAKPDLSSCKDKKGKEKTDCEKPLKEKAKADAKAAKDKVKEAKMALDCCKNPKKKGCTP